MRIPNSVNKLTVYQYVQLFNIEQTQDSEIDKAEKILSLVSGLSIEQINELPFWKLEVYFKRIATLRNTTPTKKINKYIRLGRELYKLCPNEKNLNTNQLITADTILLNSPGSYHQLAACVYMRKPLFKKPFFNSENFGQVCEQIKNVKLGKISGAVFFYTKRFLKQKKDSQASLNQAHAIIYKRIMEMQTLLETSHIGGDGTTLSMQSQVETHLKRMN